MAKPRTNLPGYFEEISRRLQMQADILTCVVTHRGLMGDNDHQSFAELLRQNLPARYGVDTGFVVNSESDRSEHAQSISSQCDILILDILNNAPLCTQSAFRVCPIEMVLGVIEFTRLLSARKLKEDIQKLVRVRKLADTGKKHYMRDEEGAGSLRPRAYIVAIDSEISSSELIKQVDKIDDNHRLNAILIIKKNELYVRKILSSEWVRFETHALFRFFAVLSSHMNSFPVGPADLAKYLPSLEDFMEPPLPPATPSPW
ncbi:DUF6602 domain-containing protein [Prosthecobacter sp. SYSU 5D2]|uniref:DUF6602 domain-containing protein n=1 Tax=Prosthecobacter sp. SYSU 5D2 TaxID=3134134 RepID=UPI0031FEB8AD